MKKLLFIFGVFLSLTSLMFFTKADKNISQDDSRFKYYRPVDAKPKTIKVMYLTWGNRNLPNFIRLEDYNKFAEQEKLIQYCFYVDSKNIKSLNFNKTIKDNFTKKIPVELQGKFFKTSRFDDKFPSAMFEDLRKTNDLGFDTPNEDYLVFVID